MEETLHGAEDICQQLIIGSYFVLSSLIEYISNCKGPKVRGAQAPLGGKRGQVGSEGDLRF